MQTSVPTKPTHLFWVFALSLLGVISILLAVAWVNGNMTLPGVIHRLFQDKFGWPWLSFEENSVGIRATIDVALTAAAYFCTSLVTVRATRLQHPKIRRAFAISALGAGLFSVMSCWQYTGITVWSFRTPIYVSDIFYYALITFTAWIFPKSKALFPLALAFLLTPFMSLDRLLFSLITLIFLIILIKFSRIKQATSMEQQKP